MNAFECHRARASFDLYLDGTLSAAEAEALEDHLLACAACASAVGDDIHLGAAIEESVRSAPPLPAVPAPGAPLPWVRRAAAAVLLLVAGGAIGHFVTRGSARGPEGGTAGYGPGGDLVPLTEVVEEPWVGLASFTDKELFEAERDALRTRTLSVETELDFVRPLVEEAATPERVVARLRDHIRQRKSESRRTQGNGPRMGDVWRHVRVASTLLKRNPEAAYEPVAAWLRTADTPLERRTAVRLLGALRVPEAHDLLVAQTSDPQTRELAVNGLVALRDPRSLDLFGTMVDLGSLPLELRLKAAGGLHRLGDPRGLEFLMTVFRAHRGPPDGTVPREILFHIGANPTREARAVLSEVLDGVRLEGKDRAEMAEWLALSGLADGDPALMRLIEREPEREPRRPPPPPHERGHRPKPD